MESGLIFTNTATLQQAVSIAIRKTGLLYEILAFVHAPSRWSNLDNADKECNTGFVDFIFTTNTG
jgi:hypothetical protein